MTDPDADDASATDREPDAGALDYDVVVVGGGPAGCSAGVFTARAGLTTAVFDRGRASLKQCAYLENYLGFPEGVDIETLYELFHDHAEAAGCTVVPDMVESVERGDGDDFLVTPKDGEAVTAGRVVAATRYDGEYMRGLDDHEAMFETREYHGEQHEQFDRDYPDRDGRTPVEGLYVVSPADEADRQAIMAAGRGARVAHRVIADARIDDGWWEAPAEGRDWVRRAAQLDAEWQTRERWIEWFDDRYAAGAPVDTASETYRRVRDAVVDEARSSYIDPEEIERRTEAGQAALAGHLDPETVVAAHDDDRLLDAMDDETIRAYVESTARAGDGSVR